MRNLRTAVFSLILNVFVVPSVLSAAPAPSIDSLLPKTTVGFVTATNYPRLEGQWNKTQIGDLLKQPVMKPFEEDLRAQIQNQWSDVADRLGIHLEDLSGVPTGEASLALMQTTSGTNAAAATALLMDVSGNAKKAEALLETARKGLTARGASETILTVQADNKAPVVKVYVFNVPPPAGAPAAAPAARGAAPAAAAPAGPSTLTVYFLTDTVFCACDDLKVTKDIIARLVSGKTADSLAQVTSYQKVMKRCATDAGADHLPNIRWFIYPLGYAEADRAATPAEKRRRGKTIIEIMRKQGFAAFQAIGGYVDVSSDGYQILHRTAVYAPKTWDNKSAMNMFVFPPGSDFAPQPWVSRSIATYFTAYIDPLAIFDHFGPLYDEVLDAPGVWAQTIDQMKNDKDGPQIDLRNELVANLGQRLTMIADYRLPVTTKSERLLWAIEVKNGKNVAAAIAKCVNNDPTIKPREIKELKNPVWEIVEEEDTGVPQIKIEAPGLTPKKDSKKSDDDDDKESHFLPHGAITVANGQLFIASHIDFLLQTLKPTKPDDQLATQKEFLKVWNLTLNDLGMKQQSARSFSWTDRAVQPTYELLRQGKMPQSESLLGRTLNSLSAPANKGVPRKQKINGSKLPDFSVIAPSLGPATASMTAETDGWFVKGVLVTKEETKSESSSSKLETNPKPK